MISIDNKLVSDEIAEKQFVCDLNKCKGGCCKDGDAGAPLELSELDELIHNYEVIKPYLTEAGIKAIEQQGKYIYNRDFGWVTPTIKEEMCAYGYKDAGGVIKCGIETAFNEGKLTWKKPISCHLFPIRVKRSEQDKNLEYLNYEPRQDLCKAACKLGKRLQVPVYVFLKEALVRKYGEAFYQDLEAAALYMEDEKRR